MKIHSLNYFIKNLWKELNRYAGEELIETVTITEENTLNLYNSQFPESTPYAHKGGVFRYTLYKDTSIAANAICATCGTARENSTTGFCINNHDNWLENGNDILDYGQETIKKFKITPDELLRHIHNNISL